MAFALTSFRSRGIQTLGSQPDRAIQQVVLTVTGLATDVALDLGDDTPGTFWTAALADATYGDLALAAQGVWQGIISNAAAVARAYIPELSDRLQAAATSGTSYTVAIQNSRRNWAFAASNGLTAYTVFFEYLLNPGVLPIESCFGVSVG